jgi:hypothetical protein
MVEDAELAAVCAEPLELEEELRGVAAEVSQHDADREAELATHRAAVDSLREQVTEARSQLEGANEVVNSLGANLTHERNLRLSDWQALLDEVSAAREYRSGLARADNGPDVAVEREHLAEIVALRSELLSATKKADRKRELLEESQAEGRRLTELLKDCFEAQAEFAQEVCGEPPASDQPLIAAAWRCLAGESEKLSKAREEVEALRSQLNAQRRRGTSQQPRLAELRASLPQLQAEASRFAAEAERLRLQATEGGKRAEESEAVANEAEERFRRVRMGTCQTTAQAVPSQKPSPAREAPRSPEPSRTIGNPGGGAVSRRLSFSPFDVSRDGICDDIESSPGVNETVVLQPASPSVKMAPSTAFLGLAARLQSPNQEAVPSNRAEYIAYLQQKSSSPPPIGANELQMSDKIRLRALACVD